ncbi:N-acetyltransferase [Deinococcus psychrotolerans]|uniref:N-acetyltransferase n=1 Tax=Deinococcus psychrotolerans TaxID=2489213 RepID=A0A3G8YCI7_9DEIO|nr:GNAT family protein [Deinococcus psychrotolerans]AZI42633.1 N-acetyltransferase [Deinococcus psychrotolerans]
MEEIEHIQLRPLRPGDEEAAVRWGADEEFCRAADWTVGLAPNKIREHWAKLIATSAPDFVRLGIELSGALIGHVDLAYLTPVSGEFGIGIERPRWRQGVGLAAGKLLLKHAFEVLKLEEVTALVHAPNLPSHALMLRLGFVEEGECDPEEYQGETVPVTRYLIRTK